MTNEKKVFHQGFLYLAILMFCQMLAGAAFAWSPLAVADDPLLRMPGTQPAQGINLEAPGRCLNCHAGYNSAVEPGHNWKGSMMAQASRDPIFWACMTVAAQDSIWALGNPNAVDLCERCHFPTGWLQGRSDPPNASLMTGSDYDGLSCDFCHQMWDPNFETTYNGSREGSDWSGYWDETSSLSSTAAGETYAADQALAADIQLFRPGQFFINNLPKYAGTYTESGSGQFFISDLRSKRASFADAGAKHQMLYSRFHKSKYFCATCHDVSNPALANAGLSGLPDLSGGSDLITEQYAASSYFHVERTFSEFMLSDYGQQGGAATNADFQTQGAPTITHAAKCQDCHMRDVVGAAANKSTAVLRSDGSLEHPQSGQPLHDLTGGNAWISYILASLDQNGPVYDATNAALLNQGPAVLTLDLSQGESPLQNGAALKDGSDRALQQLQLAATLKNHNYDPASGSFSVTIQNNSGHKLISGFPEGRRMFLNVKLYKQGQLIFEINPYSSTVGTLKGMPGAALSANEQYVDELVYEIHPSSSLTGEEQTFHFVLATGRSKDNRIPPRGFDIAKAPERHSEPVWHNASAPDYFSAAEYAGGYDAVALNLPAGADYVETTLYYQGTSREYIAFLRDEINGTASTLTLTGGTNPAGGTETYLVQSDPFFAQLKAWGNVIWDLWFHNHGLDGSGAAVAGIVPVNMTRATWGSPPSACTPPTPILNAATPGNGQVTLSWSDEHTGDEQVTGYRIYYDQAGKSQLVAEVGKVTTYTDSGLSNGSEVCYKVTTLYAGCESDFSNILCAIPNTQGQAIVSATALETGLYVTTGKGKNAITTWTLSSTFSAGDTVTVRARVVDKSTGLPLANATADFAISGPQNLTLTSGPSDADGFAEASWKTSTPNKRGIGGTPTGSYSVTLTGVTLSGYSWDSGSLTTLFVLQ